MTDRAPGLTRRDFMRLGVVAGPASLVAACGWDGGAVIEPRLRALSRLNDWVGEKILLSSSRLAPQYPVSARTALAQFPAYSITLNRTNAFPDPPNGKDWALEVGGLVRTPVRLTRAMLEAMPHVTYTVKHHCVEGWTAIGTWTGVPVSAVSDMVQPTGEARYLRFNSFDSDYMNGWDLTSAMHPQTILAYAFNDRPLTAEHGAPLRLYSPIKLGYKLTKYLSAMTFTRERPGGYWEDEGYPWLGGV
ncbi:MAG: molybdopterin-dependent oxidoreductase [Gemmatimonadales bacterium]